jgi:type IV pilus assembly protein PilV
MPGMAPVTAADNALRHRRAPRRRRGGRGIIAPVKARGFTLLEVLVSLLILSIGMSGIAALLVHTLLTTRTTIARTHALDLVSDISERIRVNRHGLSAYNGAATDHDCEARALAAPCTAHERAEQDLFDWDATVAAALPGGTGTVEIDTAVTPAAAAVTLAWHEPGAAGSELMRYSTRLRIAER